MAETKTKAIVKDVRFMYLNTFSPRKSDDPNEKPKYGCTVLFKKGDKEAITAINAAVAAAVEQGVERKWGGKKPPTLKIPVRDGDSERPGDPNFSGCYFMNATSSRPVKVINRQREELKTLEQFAPGDHGVVSLNFFPYANAGNKGIGVGVNAILKTRDSEERILTGMTRPEVEFAGYLDESAAGGVEELSTYF